MDSFTASLTVTEDVSEQTSTVTPLASDLTRDASIVLSDTANKLNLTATVNRTIPWDNQTALDERFQQWARLENLPDFRDWEVVQFFALCIFVIFQIPVLSPVSRVCYATTNLTLSSFATPRGRSSRLSLSLRPRRRRFVAIAAHSREKKMPCLVQTTNLTTTSHSHNKR